MDMQFNIVNQYESLAGEDFAFYQECMTGIFILVGTGESALNHNLNSALEEINSTYTK